MLLPAIALQAWQMQTDTCVHVPCFFSFPPVFARFSWSRPRRNIISQPTCIWLDHRLPDSRRAWSSLPLTLPCFLPSPAGCSGLLLPSHQSLRPSSCLASQSLPSPLPTSPPLDQLETNTFTTPLCLVFLFPSASVYLPSVFSSAQMGLSAWRGKLPSAKKKTKKPHRRQLR